MAKYLDSTGLTHLVQKLKKDVIPAVKVNAAAKADSATKAASADVATKANSVDAANIVGTIPISKIPQGALERVVTVADETAWLKLTTSQVQLGDTVKVTSTGRMYIVIDESKLTSKDGYMEYAAGHAATADSATNASAVPWTGVTGKPSTFAPSAHNHTASVKIGKADSKTVSTSTKLSLSVADILGTAPTTSGSGNAITAISISGDTITAKLGGFIQVEDFQDFLNMFNEMVPKNILPFQLKEGETLYDRFNTSACEVVFFDEELTATPAASALANTSLNDEATSLAIFGSWDDPSIVQSGVVNVRAIYARVAQQNVSTPYKYYINWRDKLKVVTDIEAESIKLRRNKIYVSSRTGKAYFPYNDTMLREIDGGDHPLTNTEIDTAITAAG